MLLLANKDFQLNKKRQTVYLYCNLAFALSTLSFSVLNKGTADIWRHCNIVALESDKTRNQTTWQSWKRPKVQAVLFGSNTGTDCKWNVSDSLLQGKTVTLCTRMCQRKHTYFRFNHTKKKKIPLTLFISIYWKQVNVRGKKKVYPTIQPLVEQDFAAIPWINSYVSDFYLQCCLNLLMLMGICLCTALWMYYHSISVRFELGHCSTLNPPPFFSLPAPCKCRCTDVLEIIVLFYDPACFFMLFFFFLFPRIWLYILVCKGILGQPSGRGSPNLLCINAKHLTLVLSSQSTLSLNSCSFCRYNYSNSSCTDMLFL